MERVLPKKRSDGAGSAGNPPGTDAPDHGLPGRADPRLADVFGEPVPLEESVTWAGMTEPRRAKALQRVKALDRFCAEEGAVEADRAAADAGMKLRRFYQVAAQWRKRRSLSSLGAYGSVTKTRQGIRPEVANALQAAAPKVVRKNPDASVTSLARALAVEAGLTEKPPALNTLRQYVERELRRRRQAELAGAEILFDLSASSLLATGGRPYVVFLIVDRGTGLILGRGLGFAEDSAGGYRDAAADALRRIPTLMPPAGIWASRLERSQIVPGADAATLGAWMDEVKLRFNGPTPQMTGERRSGDYIRDHVGLRLGPIRLTPARTTAAPPPRSSSAASAGLSLDEARSRLDVAIVQHDEALLSDLRLDGAPEPPDELLRLMTTVAAP